MAKILAAHSITVPNPLTGTETVNFYFLAPTASYQGLETESGVTIPDGPDFDKYDKCPLCTVEALLVSGVAVRKTLVVEISGKTRRYEILVAKDKTDTFDTEAKGQSYRGGTIKRVNNSLKASYF